MNTSMDRDFIRNVYKASAFEELAHLGFVEPVHVRDNMGMGVHEVGLLRKLGKVEDDQRPSRLQKGRQDASRVFDIREMMVRRGTL